MDSYANEAEVPRKTADSIAEVKTLSSKWHKFIEGTTLHGIRHIFEAKKTLTKLVWLLFLLSSASYFLFLVQENIAKYYKFPMTTAVRSFTSRSMTFPAVSICPSNILQKRKIYSLDTESYFHQQGLNLNACNVTAAVRNGRPCGHALLCCCVSVGPFSGHTFVSNCSEKYRQDLLNALNLKKSSFNMEEFLRVYSRNISNLMFFRISSYGPKFAHVTERDFVETITEFGKCFTFNSGKSGSPIKRISASGSSLGLNLVLDLAVDENVMAMWADGVRIIIHNQGEYFDLWNGILVSPGTLASVLVHKRKLINLPHPYETKCESQNLEFYPVYTGEGCMQECFALAYQDSCGCRMTGSGSANKVDRVCYSDDLSCTNNASEAILQHHKECYCSTPCEQIEYFTEQSVGKFPDQTTGKLLLDMGYSVEYAKNNLAYLQIGFKSLSYEQLEQQPSYDTGTLLSQIGGNMGMFLGCSLLTLCEFLSFFASCIL